MKKTCLFTVALSLLFGTTFAYTEHFENGFANPVTLTAQKAYQKKIEKAIELRRAYYLRSKKRSGSYNNRKNQINRHIESQKDIHVNDQSTQIKRDGELLFVPYYDQVQGHSNVSYIRPNRKQIFRRRAINYYREGGYAGKNELKNGVIYGSQYRVDIIPSRWMKKNKSLEGIITTIRDTQRKIGKSKQVATGYQKTTFRRGASSRNFMSPYQR